MRPTHYVEADEEIISVVDTLRRSKDAEAVFVFPKNALVLRSLVNLRLLAREAEKLGKRVTIVTGDEQGKKLAVQAGLPVEERLESYPVIGAEMPAPARPMAPAGAPVPPPPAVPRPQMTEIGSSSFFAPGAASASTAPPRRVAVRDRNPNFQPALNSALQAEVQEALRASAAPRRPAPAPVPAVPYQAPLVRAPAPAQAAPNIKRFFNNQPGPAAAPSPVAPKEVVPAHPATPIPPPPPPRPTAPLAPDGRPKLTRLALAAGGAVLLGAVVWLMLPRAEIVVKPSADRLSVDERFELSASSTPSIRAIEVEQTVTVKYDATGSGALSDRRAKGRVTIYNEYGKDSQPLVATTRLQTVDGKIFRLESAVVVPGMQDGRPGTIEAAVIADQPGAEYNIGPSTFTIPGFQGSAKYQKFSAKSASAFTGGGGQAATVATITQTDVNKAKEEAEKQAAAEIRKALEAKLSPGEKLLDGAIKQESLSGVSTPSIGAAAAQFEYQLRAKATALVFAEEPLFAELKRRLAAAAEAKGLGLVGEVSVEYGLADPNFEKKTLNLRPQATGQGVASVDAAALEQAFLGKSEDELESVLAEHPEVGSMEVGFNHSFLGTSIPSSPGRVEVRVTEPNP